MLLTDSSEYEILSRAAAAIALLDSSAISCEIGLREGGGTRHILDAFAGTNQLDRTHIAIDPYGNVEYETSEGQITRHNYTNTMRNRCFQQLYRYAEDLGINVLVFVLEDSEFFQRYSDGVVIYQETKRLATKYALVHFDGPHSKARVKVELDFFTSRLTCGAMVVFDDVNKYDHFGDEASLDFWLQQHGFKLVERGKVKASYQYLNGEHSL